MRCWFTTLGYRGCQFRFDGEPDRAHLIPAQRIRHAGLAAVAWDPRVIVPACRRHHDMVDARNALNKIELTYDQYPDSVREFAAEHGFFWASKRDGWLKSREKAA